MLNSPGPPQPQSITTTAPYRQAPVRFPIPKPYAPPSSNVFTGLNPAHSGISHPIKQKFPPGALDLAQELEAVASQPVYDYTKSTEDANKELKELISGAIEDGIKDVPPEGATVDDFVDGIVLKPHQVI